MTKDNQPAGHTAGDERDAFERWYCDDAKSSCGLVMAPAEIAKLRDGEGYGQQRLALNSKWEGWQARAALRRAQPEQSAQQGDG